MDAPKNQLARVALGCALGCLSAVLLTLSFAPYDAWFLVWIGLVPMTVAHHRVLPPRLAALAPALGVGGFVAGCFGGSFFPPAAAWYMKLLPLLVGVLVLFSSRGDRARYERRSYALWPLRAAMGWVAFELLRSLLPVLGTWGLLGYALYRQTWFLQPVSVVGMFGLDLLIVAANYALAMLVLALLDRREPVPRPGAITLPRAARWCAGVLVALALWSAASLAMRPRGGATVRVAALQPGRRPWRLGATPEARNRAMFALLSEQTRQAASRGARLIVWPESAFSVDPHLAFGDELASLAREARAYLFVGYRVQTPVGLRNEVLTVGPDGAYLGWYGKAHPVLFLGGSSVSRGTFPTYETPFGRVAAIICYDMDFTDTAREMARRGAQLIAVPSADWPEIATTHYVHGVFRALETGAAVVKSEFSVDSAIIDGSGAILASAVTPRGSAAVLVADVALHTGLPPAARFGDWVGWLCVAGLVAERLARLRERRAGLSETARSP